MAHQSSFIFLSIFLVLISSNGSACFAARLLLDPPKEQFHTPMPSKSEKPTFQKYEISPMPVEQRLPKYEHPPEPAKPRHFPPRFSFPKPEEPTFSLPQLTPKSELAPALPPSIPKTEFPPKPKFHTSPKHELPPKFQGPNTTWPKVHESQTPPKSTKVPSMPEEQTLPKSAFPPLSQALPKSQEPAQFHNLITKPEEQTLPAKSVFPPLTQAVPKSQEPAPSDQYQVSTSPKLEGPVLPKSESPPKFEFPSSPEEKSRLPKPEIPSFHNPHPKMPKFQQHTIPKTALPPRPEGHKHQMPKPVKTEPALTPMPNAAALPPISTP